MNIAQGSHEELRYYFLLCGDLQYLPAGTGAVEIEEVARLLGAYAQTLLRSRDS